LKQVSAGRQEAERKRKQVETQLAETQLRLAELEKGRGEVGDKATKLQVLIALDTQTIHAIYDIHDISSSSNYFCFFPSSNKKK